MPESDEMWGETPTSKLGLYLKTPASELGFYLEASSGLEARTESLELCLVCRLTKTVMRLKLVATEPKPVCTGCFNRFAEAPASGRFNSACTELHTIEKDYQGRIGGEGADPMLEVVTWWKALAAAAFTDWVRLEQVSCNPPRPT